MDDAWAVPPAERERHLEYFMAQAKPTPLPAPPGDASEEGAEPSSPRLCQCLASQDEPREVLAIGSEVCSEVFRMAELPDEMLAKVWDLTCHTLPNALTATEWVCAMHLLTLCREGKALPERLPAQAFAPVEASVAGAGVDGAAAAEHVGRVTDL